MEPVALDWMDAFARTGADASVSEYAAKRIVSFLEVISPTDRRAVHAARAAGSVEELLDAFRADVSFGTGGCRAKVGLGPNRFNSTTLTALVAAHAQWLHERGPAAARGGVVLGWDTRCFYDVEGVFDEAFPPSVVGWDSAAAADLAARVYVEHGIDVWWPNTGGTVGALSFAIRALNASAGLYISASHNPPDHNGAKFYRHTGGQVVPPEDEAIASWRGAPAAGRRPGRRKVLSTQVRDDWLQVVSPLTDAAALTGLHVVYSALHGSGAEWVPRALRRLGAVVSVVSEQHHPDGRFTTVVGGQPNPENALGLEQAIALAQSTGAHVAMATDPDADRIGVAIPTGAGWRVLNGNEIALVCTEQACRAAAQGDWVLRTAVTTQAVSRLARVRGLRVRDDAPVGFKYLGVQMDELDGGFAVAVEESHGVLVSDALRDKDAVGAAVMVARAAATEPLDQTLARLERELGPWATHLATRALSGPSARTDLDTALAALRRSPPDVLLDARVVRVEDGWAGPPATSTSEQASRNVLRLWFADAVVTLRPSGTEAKVKAYAECWRPAGASRSGLQERARALAQAALSRVSGDAARTEPGTAS